MYIINHSVTGAASYSFHAGTSADPTITYRMINTIEVYGYIYQSNGTYAKGQANANCFAIGYV